MIRQVLEKVHSSFDQLKGNYSKRYFVLAKNPSNWF
jgi:hypothetical protein